jgi:hypothetical protein
MAFVGVASVRAHEGHGSEPDIVRGITLPVDPRETFYSTYQDSHSFFGEYNAPSTPIDLFELGLRPGDEINLTRQGGYYQSRPAWDPTVVTPMMGVFSSTDEIITEDDSLVPQRLHRIPGAISVGENSWVSDMWYSRMRRDIPEDFLISWWTLRPDQEIGRNITIPEGARYLFLSTGDAPVWDNSPWELGYSVRITLLRATHQTLCRLTHRFVASSGIANSLCVKLEAAAAATARGNTNAAARNVQAYIHEVNAQTGRSISSENAAALIYFANRL